MPTAYKGTVIPLSSDLADGPAAFRDYTDSLPGADALSSATIPVGSVVSTVAATAPVNWLLLDGTTVAGAQTAWPKLWAVVPAAWRSGVDLLLPDARGRSIIGVDPTNVGIDAIGEKAGASTIALAEANLPPHAHAQQGSFGSGGATARHNHGAAGGGQFIETFFGAGISAPAGSGARGSSLTNTDTPDHAHFTTISGPTGNGNGTAAAIPLLHPVIAFNYIIRAA